MMQKNRSFWSRCIWRNRANGWTVIAAVAGLCCVVSPATLYAAPSDLVTASGGKDIFAVEFLDEDQVTGDETRTLALVATVMMKPLLFIPCRTPRKKGCWKDLPTGPSCWVTKRRIKSRYKFWL